MENDLYRDMCSKLHTSINEEELIMHQKRNGKPRIAALLLAAALLDLLALELLDFDSAFLAVVLCAVFSSFTE